MHLCVHQVPAPPGARRPSLPLSHEWVSWHAPWAQSRRHCQRATSSARALKKGCTDAAPRGSGGLWQPATPPKEGGPHRRSAAGPEKWEGAPAPIPKARSTPTPPRGLRVERGERAYGSLAKMVIDRCSLLGVRCWVFCPSVRVASAASLEFSASPSQVGLVSRRTVVGSGF